MKYIIFIILVHHWLVSYKSKKVKQPIALKTKLKECKKEIKCQKETKWGNRNRNSKKQKQKTTVKL